MRILILVALILFSFTKSQPGTDNPITDLIKMNLNGNVKSINKISYKIIVKSSGEFIKGKRGGKILGEGEFIIFNKKGNKISEFDNYDNRLALVYTYNYDDKENVIEKSIYEFDSIVKKGVFNYYKGTNDIEVNWINYRGDFEGKMVYNYDIKGKLNEMSSYDIDGSLYRKYSFKYDIKGNNIELYSYSKSERLVRSKNLTYYENGNIKTTHLKSYSVNNNILNETRNTYDYTYDNKENWITSINYRNGIPEYIIERKIEYFE